MSFADAWAQADPDAVGGTAGKPPGPGEYTVALIDAKADTSKSGNAYAVLTLRDARTQHEWGVLFGFKSQGSANFAKNQIRQLGVDVDAVADLAELDQSLKAMVGGFFEVEVVAASDPQYDASTYIRERATAGHASVSDIPNDVQPVAAGNVDGDIPF